jgi:hypothetical protein
VLASGREPALFLRASGPSVAVDRATRNGIVEGTEVSDAAWDALAARVTGEPFVARLSVPPGREMEFIEGEGHAYVGTGLVFMYGDRSPADLLALRGRCEAAGGALVLERGTPEQKRTLGVWGNSRSSHGVVAAALKARFDPHGVLAPGRMPA